VQLPQIGLQHPHVKQLRAVLRHRPSRDPRLLIVEGLWAHELLLELATPIEVFLWCPEAAAADEARRCSRRLAARAAHAYRVSARVLARLTARDRPDGMVSLVRLPAWDPAAVPLRR
jgi:TrmH family RNA methyltransferase